MIASDILSCTPSSSCVVHFTKYIILSKGPLGVRGAGQVTMMVLGFVGVTVMFSTRDGTGINTKSQDRYILAALLFNMKFEETSLGHFIKIGCMFCNGKY